ncbi:MAG: hypothetical protein K2M75_05255 [Clostridia bacterium]|nr:hypothetical protein [Clostridia bacterium]
MKKYAKIIVAILLILLLATALFACINPDNDTEGQMTLVVLNGDNAKEYAVDLAQIPSGNASKGLIAVLDYLKGKGQLSYASNDSGYGAYLTQVNELKEQGGYYLYVYTDVQDDFDVSQYAQQITYKNKSYTNSGVGVSQMSVKAGCTIIISTIYYG